MRTVRFTDPPSILHRFHLCAHGEVYGPALVSGGEAVGARAGEGEADGSRMAHTAHGWLETRIRLQDDSKHEYSTPLYF